MESLIFYLKIHSTVQWRMSQGCTRLECPGGMRVGGKHSRPVAQGARRQLRHSQVHQSHGEVQSLMLQGLRHSEEGQNTASSSTAVFWTASVYQGPRWVCLGSPVFTTPTSVLTLSTAALCNLGFVAAVRAVTAWERLRGVTHELGCVETYLPRTKL